MKKTANHWKKSIAVFTILCMLFTFMPMNVSAAESENTVTSSAPEFKDTTGHWGAEAITKWSGYGIINGYEGMFRPDDSITRGEMAVILDNMMDYQAAATNTFVDLQAGQFYTEAILKANAAGIIKGDGTTVRPLDKITREESAVMMSRAFAVAGASATKNFNDASAVSVWAKSAVFGMEVAGYVNGYNGNFDPKSNITRAAAVTMINNIVKAYYTEAGTYTEDVNGTAVIKVAGVVLKGVDVSGNLIIAEGVAKGDATLDSVTVKGETVVRGGGENSIHIIGTSDITSIRIEKVGDKVRIVIANGLTVDTVEVAVGEEIIITGTVGTVEISAPDATVYATGAKITTATVTGSDSTIIVDAKTTIGTMNIASTAENTSIQTQTGAVINTVNASAEISVSGTGSVNTVELNAGADGSSITTPNTTTNVDSGVTGTTGTGGTAIPAGSTGTNGTSPTAPATIETTPTTSGGGSSGGGGGTPSATVAVSEINIIGDVVIGANLNASTMPQGATGTYQWKIADAVNGTYTDILGATSKNYVVVADDAGKFIKVTFTASGNYIGTQTSGATEAVATAKVTTSEDLKNAISASISGDTILVSGELGSTAEYTVYDVTKAITIKGVNTGTAKAKVYGTFNVKANATITNLEILNKGGIHPDKNAINVVGRAATITNNTFTMNSSAEIANGLVVWATDTGTANLTITGNKFVGYVKDTGEWASAAFLVVEGTPVNAAIDPSTPATSDITITNEEAMALANEYINCNALYEHKDWSAADGGVEFLLNESAGRLANVLDTPSVHTMKSGGTILLRGDITVVDLTVPASITINVLSNANLTITGTLTISGTLTGDGSWTEKK